MSLRAEISPLPYKKRPHLGDVLGLFFCSEWCEWYIRRELARSINLRNTPDVRFILDQSIEYGVSMSKKIDEINAAMHEREREASEE